MSGLQTINSTFVALTDSLNQFGLYLPYFDFYESDSYRYAKALKQNDLFQINTSLESYNDLINDGPVPGEDECTQTQRHLKRFLKKFELSTSEKVYNFLSDGHLIEIYSKSHQQIYRSVNFFNISSYDLGALTFIPWDKLFYRSEKDTEIMFKEISFLLENNIECMTPKIPVHFLTELCTNKKFGYKMVKLAIVTDLIGHPMGYLTIISVKEVLGTFAILQ